MLVQDEVYASVVTTETADVKENGDPEEDELVALALTTLKESEAGESDRDEDEIRQSMMSVDSLLPLMLTTQTKADGDSEHDEEEQDLVVALTTTSTSNIGEQESDPEEDVFAFGTGMTRPLAYRFAEQALLLNPNVRYDATRQVHVLPDGRVAVDAIRDRTREIR